MEDGLILENRLLSPVAEKVVTVITIKIQNKSAETPAQQDTKSSAPIQLDVLIEALAPPLRQEIQARRQSYQATLTSEASPVANTPAKTNQPTPKLIKTNKSSTPALSKTPVAASALKSALKSPKPVTSTKKIVQIVEHVASPVQFIENFIGAQSLQISGVIAANFKWNERTSWSRTTSH